MESQPQNPEFRNNPENLLMSIIIDTLFLGRLSFSSLPVLRVCLLSLLTDNCPM